MKSLKIVIICLIFFGVAGCATTGSQSPQQAARISGQLFNFKTSGLMWVEGGRGISGLLARSLVSSIGTSSPTVADLVRRMNLAKTTDVRIGVAGPDSEFTANVIITALRNTEGKLPGLHLAFIGAREQEASIRAAVIAKGGKFLFSLPTAR